MSQLTFHCSDHGEQQAASISVGIIAAVPVRITLKCGCCWVWTKDMAWKQQVLTNDLHELARREAGPVNESKGSYMPPTNALPPPPPPSIQA